MSDQAIIIVALIVSLCVLFIGMAVVVAVLTYKIKAMQDLDPNPDPNPNPNPNPEPVDDEELDAPIADELAEEPIVKQPVPFDPGNPPHRVTYAPRSDAPTRTCHCHDRVVQPGQQVWLWPMPESPAVLLICDDAIPQGKP